MKISNWIPVMACVALGMTSCNKNQFDPQAWNDTVDYQFMIDNVDPYHDWCLTKHSTIFVKTTDDKIRSVQIVTANPYTTNNAEIVAESMLFGVSEEVAYTVPALTNELYAVAYDVYGNDLGYIPFEYDAISLDLSLSALAKPGTIKTIIPQTYTYLYVSTFPQPTKFFDYNDMVLRISKRIPDVGNTLVVDLAVKLDACGTQEPYAAAIQLAGIRYDDLEKVEVIGDAMDKGFPSEQRTFIENDETLIRGRNGEAVISLFENAHWAFKKEFDELGDIPALYYNTNHTAVEEKSAIATPVVATYRITFKDREKANSLTLDRIDPFLMHRGSNGGTWEVHTYPHKYDGTLWESNAMAYNNNVSWALVVPKRDFRYPIEGMPLSTYNSELDATFGPYDTFAEWMKNHQVSVDWYLNVTRPQLVY